MTNAEENIKVINKNNSGFPDYLDFEKLRTEGIEYLGRLSGKTWTDHNVHDPGITILEVLCYALLDLGYRTNLPIRDIFTPNPGETGKDDNFFTPAQILTCNPLTIIDYRKLLIDIKGVKNAWLTVATDQKDFCKSYSEHYKRTSAPGDCEEFLNGLYHVYIEPEKNPDKDFKDETAAKEYLGDLTERVKKSLMAHRNFCEDFVDIHILCQLQVGLCAGIELKGDADPENTYLSIVQKLRDFFSPSPHFYTLQQLLDKGKPIDEIFSGRPYNLAESHGFVDTDELLQLKLKKEIHLSDVYNVILETEGVDKIANFELRTCGGNNIKPDSDWKFKLPENHVPDFSMECSGFQFTRNGLPVVFDTKKYEGLFKINFTHNGKVLYQSPSPYLDKEIPKGIYHHDLDEYFLLQNDFPRVYGIAEGGLPENVSNLRKAQALQLKGYLLFFDQLLAGYLAQLKNIRSLFALSSSGDKDKQRTYFLNKLESLPELNKLLRFTMNGDESNGLGKEGSILVRAVSKNELNVLISLNQTKVVDPLVLPSFTFSTLEEQQIAISELKDDLYSGSFDQGFLNEDSSCVYYYISGSSDDFALISNTSFKTIADAGLHLSSVSYIGTFDENYRTYIKDRDNVSFALELNIASFKGYLQRIIEDNELYAVRRNSFLDHLLSRFAERFTDFALLSFGERSGLEGSAATINAKENFLANYDDISANRGRAYDYLKNKWNNNNISGFENEVKFLSGIENKQLHSLCNFVVEQYDEQYLVDIKIAGQPFFALTEKFDSINEAEDAARSVFMALSDPERLKTIYIAHEKLYAVQVLYNDHAAVSFTGKYKSSQEADTVRNNFNRMFSGAPDPEDVFISSFKYDVQLIGDDGNIVCTSAESFKTEAEAHAEEQNLVGKINDSKNWRIETKLKHKIGTLYFNKTSPELLKFVDVKSFKIDINDTIVGRPDKFTYDLLDNANSFKFYPEKEFGTSKEARQHCYFVISLASNEANYQIGRKDADGNFKLSLLHKDQIEASCYTEFSTEDEARSMQQRITSLVKAHEFTLKTEAIADGWKFNYRLGYEPAADYLFNSAKDYPSPEEALKAAKAFHQGIPAVQLRINEEGSVLVPLKENSKIPVVNLVSPIKLSEKKNRESVAMALEQQKDIAQMTKNNRPQSFKTAVKVDESGGAGRYVYRLVDKDNVLAYYLDKYEDRKQADLSRRKVARTLKRNLKYLQLCLGGDIIHEVQTTKGTLYRYQLKAHNYLYISGNSAGREIILFESKTAYTSKELAIQAFEENYLYILELAAGGGNYEELVFIPEDTLIQIREDGEGSVEEVLATLAKSYPIKRVEYGSEAFNSLFCESIDPANADPCKTGKARKHVYYFGTYHNLKDPQQWQSLKYYDTVEAARKDFIFFITLLRYPGNLYVDCNHCNDGSELFYRVYIREVLAESVDRFENEESVWGKQGLEKFICALQSGSGFHHYQRKEDCCYTFYLNCGEDFIVHPCVYDTAKKRNEVLNDLYIQFKDYFRRNSYGMKMENDELIFMDQAGKPFAKQLLGKREELKSCESLLDMMDQISGINNIYSEQSGSIFLKDSSGKVILQSYGKDHRLDKWKETLRAFACYFPLIKSRNEKTGKDSYCIELKFPGFSTCNENDETPCSCDEGTEEKEPTCFVAWKSSCCYASCDEAMQALVYVRYLLSDFENYQPLIDCACNVFGIALNFNQLTDPDKRDLLSRSKGLLSGERIAFNPQCYESAQLVCAAVERTKRLSNAEGFHVAEHILLRPRCPEDCECREGGDCGALKRHCDYQWIVSDDDPCSEAHDICFIPGSDPYSFVATVVLPAWPERFRTASGRILMEDILYRLAPAHVMLRILWLAPHDFCCFESMYKDWHRWLAKNKTCNPDFSVCDFLDFLFRRNYECLDECETCQPCKHEQPEVNPCFNRDVEIVKGDKNRFLNQVNETFCWRVTDCDQYEFTECGSAYKLKDDGLKLANKVALAEVKEAGLRKKLQKATKAEVKTAFINSRIEAYRSTATHIAKKIKGHAIVSNVQKFLDLEELSIPRFETIVMSIIQNKKSSGKSAITLNQHQILHLLECVVCYTLDVLCFKEKGQINLLNNAFEKMRKAKIDMSAIYNHWDGLDVKKHQSNTNIDAVKILLTGISKK
ncbi:hypothetical protein [Pedobacter sp. B4-66]|uniref:hypothetical protein n=1 Tax=Pedobacter sp. B4-66 TaxID=2817280 RepID=UPI001BDAD65A|nr:hypothetical protein [Pedobacter sp. B4-66]